MSTRKLRKRLEAETGLTLSTDGDAHRLAGLFSKYRPDGAGLDRLLDNSGVEAEVLQRLRRIYEATASGWDSSDIYFVVRRVDPLDPKLANTLAQNFLQGMQEMLRFRGEPDVADAVGALQLVLESPDSPAIDEDLSTSIYECLTDFLATLQPDRHELYLLKEALYSMANDYFLAAYVLWPVVRLDADIGNVLDGYFELWRRGIGLTCLRGGLAMLAPRKIPV